jgi:uncharacterized protein YkwD
MTSLVGRKTRRRTLVSMLVLTLGLGVVAAPAAQASRTDTYRTKLLNILNRTRVHHDLRPVKINLRLSDDALHWSNVMVRKNRIYDPPNLAQLLAPYQWDDVGADVVGCGSTIHEVHRIFMTEAFHRSIILHPKLRRVGIGVVRADEHNRCGRGSYWATELFYG